jgi:hypothetical protein
MRPGECTTVCVAASSLDRTGVQPFDTLSPITSTAGLPAASGPPVRVQSAGPLVQRYDTLQLSPCVGPHSRGAGMGRVQPRSVHWEPLGQQ